MKIQQTELPNGVVVITESQSAFASATIGVWVENGSRHETPELNGVSHFYEHMVFKGTQKRDPLEQVQAIEAKGGYINAYTTRDHTCFYTKVVEQEIGVATDVLCDMINAPLLEKEEFTKEKEVILEEVRASIDAPEDIIHDLFAEALWGQTGLGQPIAGYLKTVKSIDIKDLRSYQTKVKSKFRVVVSAAGAVNHKKFVKMVEEALNTQKSLKNHKAKFQPPIPKHFVKKKDVQQCNVVLGTAIVATDRRQQIAMNIVNSIFGDGMASRLFQVIREEHGLAYSVYSCMDNYSDTMCFSLCMTLEDKKFEQAMQILNDEICKFKTDGATQEEFDQAKDSLKGGLQLSLESTSARMNFMVRQFLRRPSEEILKPAQILKLIDEVTLDDVNSLLPEIFNKKDWASSLIQPKDSKLSVKKWLKF